MSTQVKFGECLDWTTPRPYMVPDFIGELYRNPHTDGRDPCMYDEPTRRDDKLPVRFGRGIPKAESPITDMAGIPTEKVQSGFMWRHGSTPEGTVNIPDTYPPFAYTPSTDALEILTHTSGTRRLARPPRYYT